MGDYKTRLGCQLSFDTSTEGDIISLIEKLNSSHQTGKFIADLIRVAFDNTDKLGDGAVDKVTKLVNDYRISYEREKYFRDIKRQIKDIHDKVDMIYQMSTETLMVARFGRKIGIEGKAKNQLLAEFMVESQLKRLSNQLGMTLDLMESDKLKLTEDKIDKALEYIVETYEDIIVAIKEQVGNADIVRIKAESEVATQPIISNKETNIQNLNTQPVIENTESISSEDSDAEFVGIDEMGDLLNFFSE